MTDTNGGTGYQLTRELAEVKGRVEMIMREQVEDNETTRELFQRVVALEKRMAQVVMLAVLISVLVPVLVEAGFWGVN